MMKKYGMKWKSERFPGREKPGEKDLLDHLGMENVSTNRDEETSKNLLLMAILQQAFYPSLKGEAKEAANIRHKLEEPLCCKMLNKAPESKAVCRAPLVEKRGQPWVKGSVDFITIIEEDGLEVEVTEIKTQTSIQMAGHEYDRVNRSYNSKDLRHLVGSAHGEIIANVRVRFS